MLGAGILVGPETTENPTIVLNGNFKQYNWVTANDQAAVSDEAAKKIIGAALNIPFVVFFPFGVKIGSGIMVLILSCIVSIIISGPQDRKEAQKAIEEEKARQAEWKKELEEQKKREELGRWK
jgi:uncharacterized membrane protein (DUF106 family)